MSSVGQREKSTQGEVLKFFCDHLNYRYLGNWKDRPVKKPVEEGQLRNWLAQQGHNQNIIEKTLRKLDKTSAISGSKQLYDANREVYSLLRYGANIKPDIDEQTITVWCSGLMKLDTFICNK